MASLHAEPSFQWDIHHRSGEDYVGSRSIQTFYRFDRTARKGKELNFTSKQRKMRWYTGSKVISINGVRFNLSLPILAQGDQALVSKVDLLKLLDPVLRPWYIENAQSFEQVVIDPGHGGHDSGATSAVGAEKDFVLKMAQQLQGYLHECGLGSQLTRDGDTFIPLTKRVLIANKIPKAIFVSLHFNAGKPGASGIETFALSPYGTRSTNDGQLQGRKLQGNQRDAENIALATAVHAKVMNHIRALDRGVKRAQFSVLSGIDMPAILFEGGFLTHRKESQWIAREDYRGALAKAVAGGIANYHRAVTQGRG